MTSICAHRGCVTRHYIGVVVVVMNSIARHMILKRDHATICIAIERNDRT